MTMWSSYSRESLTMSRKIADTPTRAHDVPALPPERPGKVGGKRDLNRKAKITALKNAALTRFLELGIEGTTIAEITGDARVAKGSFYRYFKDKSDLVKHLVHPLGEHLNAEFEHIEHALTSATGNDAILAVYTHLGHRLKALTLSNLPLVRLYLQEGRMPKTAARAPVHALEKQITDTVVQLTGQAHAHGLWRPFPHTLSGLAVIGAVERVLLGVLRGENFEDLAHVPQSLASLVLDGLRSRPEPKES
jgi:AcrR family transcriptional regulator